MVDGKDTDDHVWALKATFQCEFDMWIVKCEFNNSVKFFGVIFSSDGIYPYPEKKHI